MNKKKWVKPEYGESNLVGVMRVYFKYKIFRDAQIFQGLNGDKKAFRKMMGYGFDGRYLTKRYDPE